jgi:hypothetical protein
VIYTSQDHLRTGMHDLNHPVLTGAKNNDMFILHQHWVRY